MTCKIKFILLSLFSFCVCRATGHGDGFRGFSIAADGVTRRYLLPRGLLRGAPAQRAVAAGKAQWLAGGVGVGRRGGQWRSGGRRQA